MLLAFALSFIKFCWPLWEVCHALKIKIMYIPHIPAAPTLGVRKTCLPSRSTQKCFTPTLGVNIKTCSIGFPSTQNKCSKFLLISLSKFCYIKETWSYAKVIHKKKRWEKMDKCLRYLKQWVLWCPPEKKERWIR